MTITSTPRACSPKAVPGSTPPGGSYRDSPEAAPGPVPPTLPGGDFSRRRPHAGPQGASGEASREALRLKRLTEGLRDRLRELATQAEGLVECLDQTRPDAPDQLRAIDA